MSSTTASSPPSTIPRFFKRIIICCDGTWQDGITEHSSKYTNVLRLARMIESLDQRLEPPVPQIVFYQSGVGTGRNFYSEYVEAATGGTLGDKVEEVYAFIAHNFNLGDEIFLFGFSRGAYTARTVASLIGEIGILDRKDMDHFGEIFSNYRKLGRATIPQDIQKYQDRLADWRHPDSRGKRRADVDGDSFTIKCLGVWDTVSSLGLPEEVTKIPTQLRSLFGFHNCLLGEHVERAYHALALNEMRANFICNKFHQSEEGIRKNQVLKQCWFAGAHSDIGGSYKDHDLADIALIWMAANISDALALDLDYLEHLLQPIATWGAQKPHDSATGIFTLSNLTSRQLPTMSNDPVTQESIHPSVLVQTSLSHSLAALLEEHPDIVCPLLPLEEEMRTKWPYNPESIGAKCYEAGLSLQRKTEAFTNEVKDIGSRVVRGLTKGKKFQFKHSQTLP